MARWLKVGIDTPYKTAIRNMAKDCGCTRGDAFLAWFDLYAWLDEQTADGRLETDHAELDRKAGLAGAAASLERSGWLTFADGVCTITNWDEHNGQNAKRRAMDARRKNEIREELRRQSLPVRSCPKMPVRKMSALKADKCPRNVRFGSGQNADEIRYI